MFSSQHGPISTYLVVPVLCVSNLHPDVSIITPYLNASSHAASFVDMLKQQTYKNWTCLLIDDKSSDDSTFLLKSFVNYDPRFQFLSTFSLPPSSGPSQARNLALDHVTTPLIAFCDIDDLWHPLKLDQQLCFHRTHNLDFSVTAYARFDEASGALISLHSPPSSLSYRGLLNRNSIPMLSVLCGSYLFSSGIRFPDSRHEDYSAWLTVFQSNPHLKYGLCPHLLSFYKVHAGNLTSNRLAMISWTSAVLSRHSLNLFHFSWLMIRWIVGVMLERLAATRYSFRGNLFVDELLERPPLLLRRGESS